jgi:hypothetical protein
MGDSDFEILVEAVRVALADDTLEFGLFRLAESERTSVRRVVWIPTEFNCEPVMQANTLIDGDTGEIGEVLFTDYVTVECHISGADFGDAARTRVQVCNAVRNALGLASMPIDGAYQTELSGHSGVMWGGMAKIIQRFRWKMNVSRLQPGGSGQVRVEHIEIPPGITADGSVGPSDGLLTTETALLEIEDT